MTKAILVDMPLQHGLASLMVGFVDLLRNGVTGSRFTLLPADGTYFQSVKYDAISPILEAEFAQWLTTEIKVAAIPVSAFYSQPTESGIVRFCFAKKDETLRLALDRLAML